MIGLILHRDGIILDLSEETAAIFGYTRAELLGAALSNLTESDGFMVAGDGSEKRNRSAGSRCLGRRKDGVVVELEFLRRGPWVNE